jgi:plastocyanin
MRKLPAAAVTTVAAAAIAAGAATSLAASSVSVGDNYFVRSSGVPTVNAKKNARLTFTFVGRATHQVKVTKGPKKFSSSPKSTGTYRSPKLKGGTYTIICAIHGGTDQSMKLKVK